MSFPNDRNKINSLSFVSFGVGFLISFNGMCSNLMMNSPYQKYLLARESILSEFSEGVDRLGENSLKLYQKLLNRRNKRLHRARQIYLYESKQNKRVLSGGYRRHCRKIDQEELIGLGFDQIR